MARPDQRSEEAEQWRRLYRTKRWLETRARQLRDHPLCAMCLPGITGATVCDHVDKDSKATEEGFFAGPFNSLCATHHNSTRQREEKRGHMIGSDESGAPLDPRHPWNKG